MYDEYNALVKNGTWILVPSPPGANLVRSIGLFKHKFHADVWKLATIRIVLSLAVSRKWLIYQLDLKNAFLNGDLSKTVMPHGPNFLTAVAILHYLFIDWALRALNYFLGISVVRHSTCLFLSQKMYALQLLERAHMVNCNPSRTPVDTESKLGPDGVPVQDPTLCRSLVGGLQYLMFRCPDLVLRILVFTYMHPSLPLCAESEYRGVANVVAETTWLCNLLRELHSPLSTATLVYYDNVSVIYMSANLVQHQQTKHIKIDIHFIRDMVTAGQVRVLHVPCRYQYADVFTKGLPSALFEEFRFSLSV
ncbi:ribonuclease H-like domain-containing protein [Tanacetum coccineum]|uniref:Ribonuclease H-like domain-containing protein n=1 Tax=Tanacetum coccineum TaxID=301880 RepID=A0ABQ5AMP5_9ASTR